MQKLPILPLRDTLVFPHLPQSIRVGRATSLAAVKAAVDDDSHIITVLQRERRMDEPGREALHDIGTICKITRVEHGEGSSHVILQGLVRVRLRDLVSDKEYMIAAYEELEALSIKVDDDTQARIDVLLEEILDLAKRLSNMVDNENGDKIFDQFIGSIDNPITKIYRIAHVAPEIELADLQKMLAIESTQELLELMLAKLSHQSSIIQHPSKQTKNEI